VAVNCKADRSPADFVAVKLKRALSLRDLAAGIDIRGGGKLGVKRLL
jgi:hypothetical protein